MDNFINKFNIKRNTNKKQPKVTSHYKTFLLEWWIKCHELFKNRSILHTVRLPKGPTVHTNNCISEINNSWEAWQNQSISTYSSEITLINTNLLSWKKKSFLWVRLLAAYNFVYKTIIPLTLHSMESPDFSCLSPSNKCGKNIFKYD